MNRIMNKPVLSNTLFCPFFGFNKHGLTFLSWPISSIYICSNLCDKKSIKDHELKKFINGIKKWS